MNFNELYDALRKIKDKQQAAARLRHELKQLDMEKRKLGILDEPETGDSPEGNRHVEYMMDCIRNHYSSHLSLTDISEQCGMSCTYLNSKFKRLYRLYLQRLSEPLPDAEGRGPAEGK